MRARAGPGAGSGWLEPTRGGFPYIDTGPLRATRHQESATDAGPVCAGGTFPLAGRAQGLWPGAGLLQAARRPPPAPLAAAPSASRAPCPPPGSLRPRPLPSPRPLRPHLQQQFDPLDRGDRGLGDGSGDATRQEVLQEAQSLLTHDASRAHTASGSRALALASAGPGTATPSPSLRVAKGPPASPRIPPYIPRPASRERRRDPEAVHTVRIGWAGAWTPPGRPPLLQRAKGAKAVPGGRGGLGAVPSAWDV